MTKFRTIVVFFMLLFFYNTKLCSQLNIFYSSTFELKNGFRILSIKLTNNESTSIIHTSNEYIQEKNIYKCLINRNLDFLATHDGDIEAFRNLHLAVSRIKSDTLQENSTTIIIFKYKIRYCLSNSFFVLRVFQLNSKKGMKIFFPLEAGRLIKEEPIYNYSD